MINAERILKTVDEGLDHEVQLVIYGRAAIALGFENAPEAVSRSLDVDVIVPVTHLASFQADGNFWDAQEAANQKLDKEGLYITRIFQADQVFLRRNWEAQIVPVDRPPTRWLRLFRPAALDLILTKMMRGDDAQDSMKESPGSKLKALLARQSFRIFKSCAMRLSGPNRLCGHWFATCQK